MHIALIPEHDPAQPRPWFPSGDVRFDYAAAHREGWTISEAASGVQLRRIDSPAHGEPVFSDDREAWTHVVRRARAGSPLHCQALSLIDDIERCLVEGLLGSW